MLLTLEVPDLELIRQLLENNSIHNMFYYIATVEQHINPEEFADVAFRLFVKEESYAR